MIWRDPTLLDEGCVRIASDAPLEANPQRSVAVRKSNSSCSCFLDWAKDLLVG